MTLTCRLGSHTLEVWSAKEITGSNHIVVETFSGVFYNHHNKLHSTNDKDFTEVFLNLINHAREVYGITDPIELLQYEPDE